MFVYRKGSPWYLIFSMYGSAIPRACIPGLFSAVVSFMLDVFVPYDSYLKHLIEHPYPFQPFAYIAAFVLVFRTNIAYNRYWEMATQVHLMTAKWGDALAEAVTFDELPRGKTPEERGKKLASRRRFQALMVRRFSLMHGVALQYLRRDDQLDNLSHVSPHAPTSVPMGLGTFGGPFGHESRHEAAWQLMEVLGGLCEFERSRLVSAHDRVGYLMANILHLINQRRADGGLGVDAPVLSRLYQLLSDGMLGFRQARKIEDINFPWPYTQAVSAYLAVFTVLFPLLLSKFANDGEWKVIWIGPMISFITVTSYAALHKVAKALEDPFVHPPNDLPANAFQAAFNSRLLTTWDAMRRPEDELPFAASPPPAPATTCATAGLQLPPLAEGGSLRNSGGATFSQDGAYDEDELWHEYAYLEPEEVRATTREFLLEWRQAGSGRSASAMYNPVATPKLVNESRPSARTLKRMPTTPLMRRYRSEPTNGSTPHLTLPSERRRWGAGVGVQPVSRSSTVEGMANAPNPTYTEQRDAL